MGVIKGLYEDTAPAQASEKSPSKLSEAVKGTGDVLGEIIGRTIKTGPASFNALTGGMPTQLLHDAKSVGMEKGGVHPVIAEAVSTATDPQTLMGGLMAAPEADLGAMDRLIAMRKGSQMRNAVSEFLPAAKMADDIEAGRPSGFQTEAGNLIKKTKDPYQVVSRLRAERDNVIKQVDALVAAHNQPIEPEAVLSRAKLILQKQIKNATPKDRVKMKLAMQDEMNWINEQGEFDTVAAHARKKYLYDETQGVQKRQNRGIQIVTAPEKDLVKDAFAQALKEQVERAHPDIQKLNARWSGLDVGTKAASKMAEARAENLPIGAKTVQTVQTRPNPSGFRSAILRKFYDPYSVESQTGRIEKLSREAAEASARSRLKQMPSLLASFGEDASKSNPEYFKDVLTYELLDTMDPRTNRTDQLLRDAVPARRSKEVPKKSNFTTKKK